MASGSGQYSGSKSHTPCSGQWKKSMMMTEMGSPRRLYSRATLSSSSWVRYRILHCQNPVANSGMGEGIPVARAYWERICRGLSPAVIQ